MFSYPSLYFVYAESSSSVDAGFGSHVHPYRPNKSIAFDRATIHALKRKSETRRRSKSLPTKLTGAVLKVHLIFSHEDIFGIDMHLFDIRYRQTYVGKASRESAFSKVMVGQHEWIRGLKCLQSYNIGDGYARSFRAF